MFEMDEKDSPISTLQTLVTNYFWMYEPVQATTLKILHIWPYGWRTSPFIMSKHSIHLIVMIVRLNSPIGLSGKGWEKAKKDAEEKQMTLGESIDAISKPLQMDLLIRPITSFPKIKLFHALPGYAGN